MAVPSETKSVAENGPIATAEWFLTHARHGGITVTEQPATSTIRYDCVACSHAVFHRHSATAPHPPSSSPSTPSSPSSSPTGTPELVDGSGVPPAEEWRLWAREGRFPAHVFYKSNATDWRSLCGTAMSDAAPRSARADEPACWMCIAAIRRFHSTERANRIAAETRIVFLESQVTDLQSQREAESNRRREFIASVEELIERWARS